MLTMRAGELSKQITDALDRLGAADADAAARHRGGVRVVADPPSRRDGSGRRVAGSGVRRGGGMAGDEPGPNRRADRRHDARAAAATDRRIPAAGRQHRRRALGHAGRRQPRQHRPGDRRRFRRSGIRAADRLLPHPARRDRRPRPQRSARRPADPCLRSRACVAGGTQRQPVDREERGCAGPRAEHHDRGLGSQHPDRSPVRLGDARRRRDHHLPGRPVPPRQSA